MRTYCMYPVVLVLGLNLTRFPIPLRVKSHAPYGGVPGCNPALAYLVPFFASVASCFELGALAVLSYLQSSSPLYIPLPCVPHVVFLFGVRDSPSSTSSMKPSLMLGATSVYND